MELVSIKEIAQELKLSVSTVRELCRKGDIPCQIIHGTRRDTFRIYRKGYEAYKRGLLR